MPSKLNYFGHAVCPDLLKYRSFVMRKKFRNRRGEQCRKNGRRMLLKRLNLHVTPTKYGKIGTSKDLRLKIYLAGHGHGFWPYDKIRRVKTGLKCYTKVRTRELELHHKRQNIRFNRLRMNPDYPL